MQRRFWALFVECEAHEPPSQALGPLLLEGLTAKEGRICLQLCQRHKADVRLEGGVLAGEVCMPMPVALLSRQRVDGAVACIGHPHAAPRQGLGRTHNSLVHLHCRARGHMEFEAEFTDKCQAQYHERMTCQLRVPAGGEGQGNIIKRNVDKAGEEPSAVRALHAYHGVVVANIPEQRPATRLFQFAAEPSPVVRECAAACGNVKLVLCQLGDGEIALHATALVTERSVRD
mmetsp:Transcript_82662/g.229374  ORF Transcript_82662/g.229374 Transcript_82662/m.229374 type:complete len:231 (-) Transcript_82662:912-1604(-)